MIFHATIAIASIAPLILGRAVATSIQVRTLPKSGHLDRKGAVASENSVCSHIGVGMIREGGNAADAVSKFPIFNPETILLSRCYL